jgi:sec-independent protein translocase protein TatC
MLASGFTFQIPIIQIILGKFKIVSSQQMLKLWKWVVILSTVISAIITPSTDPVTQIVTSVPLIILYFFGIIITKQYEKDI